MVILEMRTFLCWLGQYCLGSVFFFFFSYRIKRAVKKTRQNKQQPVMLKLRNLVLMLHQSAG